MPDATSNGVAAPIAPNPQSLTPMDQLENAKARVEQEHGHEVAPVVHVYQAPGGQITGPSMVTMPFEDFDEDKLADDLGPGEYAVTMRVPGVRGVVTHVKFRVPPRRASRVPEAAAVPSPAMPSPETMSDGVISVLVASMNNNNAQMLAQMQAQQARDNMMMQAMLQMMERKTEEKSSATDLLDLLDVAKQLGGGEGGGGGDGTLMSQLGQMAIKALSQNAPAAAAEHPSMPVPQMYSMPPQPAASVPPAPPPPPEPEAAPPTPEPPAEPEPAGSDVDALAAYLRVAQKNPNPDFASIADTLYGMFETCGGDPAVVVQSMEPGKLAETMCSQYPMLDAEFVASVETELRAIVERAGNDEDGEAVEDAE